LLCAGLLAPTGCANYWRARACDLADPFGLGLRLGMSVQGNARATQLVQTGIGWDMGAAWRWQGRDLYQAGGIGGEIGLAPLWHQRGMLAESSGKSISDNPKVVLGRVNGGWPDRKGFDANHDRRLYDFGVTLQAIVGVDVEFNPLEFADLLLGWFGVDLLDDDAILDEDAVPAEDRDLPAGLQEIR
jgi:hypothetical protein